MTKGSNQGEQAAARDRRLLLRMVLRLLTSDVKYPTADVTAGRWQRGKWLFHLANQYHIGAFELDYLPFEGAIFKGGLLQG